MIIGVPQLPHERRTKLCLQKTTTGAKALVTTALYAALKRHSSTLLPASTSLLASSAGRVLDFFHYHF
jgi:hypothetical protein